MSREGMERMAGTWLQTFNSGEFSQMMDLTTPGASFVADDSDDELLDEAFGHFEARDDPSYTIVSSGGDIVKTSQLVKRNTPNLIGTLINEWIIDEDQQTVAGQVNWSRPEEPDLPAAQGRLLFRLSPDSSKIQSMRDQHEAIIRNGRGRCPCCEPLGPELPRP